MNHVQDKLASLRKTGKLLKTLSTIASLLVVVVLVLYLLCKANIFQRMGISIRKDAL